MEAIGQALGNLLLRHGESERDGTVEPGIDREGIANGRGLLQLPEAIEAGCIGAREIERLAGRERDIGLHHLPRTSG